MAPALWRTILVSLVLSVAGILAVLLWLGDPSDLRALGRLSLPAVAGSLLLLAASFLAGGTRLAVLVAMAGDRVNAWRATRAFVLGLFGAAITPSGGGNGPAIALSLIRDGVRSSVAWSITVYGSISDLLFFAWAIPASALVLHLTGHLADARLLWLAFGLSAASLLLWYLLAFELARATRLGGRIFSLAGLRRWRRPAMRTLAGIGAATATVTRSHIGWHVLLQLLTIGLHLLLYSIFFLLARALGADLNFLVSQAVLLLVSATSYLVPTPGASGYLELALSYSFSSQLSAGVLAASVLTYRALSYYAAVLLGGILGGAVLSKELIKRTPRDDLPGRVP
ncbi:MAG: lysylphosphatidylglycerol synthase transmembrane domain-containing protein [Trueperaceae bacterium]